MKRKKKSPKKRRPSGTSLPGKLLGVDKEAFFAKKELAGVMIALALAFNDIRMALKAFPSARQATSLIEAGERAGTQLQVAGQIFSMIREVLVVLDEQKSILALPDFQSLLSKMPEDAKASWDRLVDAASDKTAGAGKLLVVIRNNVGFHYGPKALALGYAGAFLSESKDPLLERAVYREGETMEDTRFMFADAAVEHALENLTKMPVADLYRELERLAEDANLALRWIVTLYLRAVGGGQASFSAPVPQIE